jgi:hypothetical protein
MGFGLIGSLNGKHPKANEYATDTDSTTVEQKSPEELKKEQEKAVKLAWIAQEEKTRGRYPEPSSWDGITPEVNKYMKSNLKDYDSMKIVECSDTVTWGTDKWAQRVKYRAKNSFGGMTLENQLFIIENGQVVDVMEY